MTAIKESKAERLERLKREKNPWIALEEIRGFAATGRSTIPAEWIGSYFRWWGIYTQGDGLGVTGGQAGQGNMSDYFMMRIPLPNGVVSSEQLRTIAGIAEDYGNNLADITVRQSIQLHWLTIENIPSVIDRLNAVGLSTRSACGDVVRNVTGCPLAGLAPDELIDASPLARSVAKGLMANPDLYNLPRKFKVSVVGCPVWCSYPEINDIAFTPAVRRRQGRTEVGFSVRVGGALSKEPFFAVRLDAFVPPQDVLKVARKIVELFRDQQGLREHRDRARMKYLFLRQGWTAESFLEDLNHRLGYRLDSAAEETVPSDILRDHAGIQPQKQEGLSYVGISVLRGRLTGEQLREAANLAERFAGGDLRTTVMQNLIVANVPNANASNLVKELEGIGLRVNGSVFWRGGIACTGTEFCKLAITETKGFLRWLVDEMEDRLPGFDQPLRLHVTGCPNSCGEHWIADIGLEGKKVKYEGKLIDAYSFSVGGSIGEHQSFARSLGFRCPAPDVPDAIERLLNGYVDERMNGENLRSYFARRSDEYLRARLEGVPLAVEADVVAAG